MFVSTSRGSRTLEFQVHHHEGSTIGCKFWTTSFHFRASQHGAVKGGKPDIYFSLGFFQSELGKEEITYQILIPKFISVLYILFFYPECFRTNTKTIKFTSKFSAPHPVKLDSLPWKPSWRCSTIHLLRTYLNVILDLLLGLPM
jgi:hypothetical protein